MEYTRDTQCERCHCWYDLADLNRVGEGDGLLLCTRCVEALWPSEDSAYSERITHEGQFEDEPVAVIEPEEHSNALLVRRAAGLRVEACYMPLTDLYGVAVTLDGKQAWASCEKERLLDAYWHPAIYLSPAACAHLGLR